MPDRLPILDGSGPWHPVAERTIAEVVRKAWSARLVHGLGQTLITGAIDRAKASLAPGAAEIGLWQVAAADPVLVRIGRDRALLVGGAPLGLSPGWRAEGWAASPQDDSHAVFELRGADLRNLVAEACSADVDCASPSAAVLFAGIACLIYRRAPDVARLHVEAPFAPYLWRWLETRPDRQD